MFVIIFYLLLFFSFSEGELGATGPAGVSGLIVSVVVAFLLILLLVYFLCFMLSVFISFYLLFQNLHFLSSGKHFESTTLDRFLHSFAILAQFPVQTLSLNVQYTNSSLICDFNTFCNATQMHAKPIGPDFDLVQGMEYSRCGWK